ncbi:MAG: transketolase C-terminal domain-containing protein, partial [bacterium]
LESWFVHVPGLKVVIPSNPADAKGLLKSAIRSDDPVLYFEHKDLFRMKGPVPEGDFLVPIGKGKVVREGTDVTIVSYSATLHKALKAAEALAEEGIQAEVVDLRSIVPLDKETLFESVKKTGRLVIAHEATKNGGVGSEVAAVVAEEIIEYLDGPIKRVGAKFVPIPFSPALEPLMLPQVEDIIAAVKETF